MPQVKVREGENLDLAMRRLKRALEKASIPKELRKRDRHQPNSQKKQREKAAARKRWLKQKLREKMQLLSACVRGRRTRTK